MLRRVGFGIVWGFLGHLCGASGGIVAFVVGAWRAGWAGSGVIS
jgi:hypothetical protein